MNNIVLDKMNTVKDNLKDGQISWKYPKVCINL